MSSYTHLLYKQANKIMDCRQFKKLDNCYTCPNFAIYQLMLQLRRYEKLEQAEDERILGHN